MEYTSRALLVTGGAGFIGSHLVEALTHESPASIHVIDNLFLGREENLSSARSHFSAITLHRIDATDGEALHGIIREAGIDVVFNLATKALGYSFDDPLDAFHVNVQIIGHLLEALRLGEIKRLVHFSSSEAYGSALETPMSEAHPLLPHTPYAAGKAAADLMVRVYQKTFGTRVLTLRPFNNYGPRQNPGVYAGLIPLTISRIIRGEYPLIQGSGDQTRDFLFVRDTVRISVGLAKRDDLLGHVLNLGSGTEVSVKQVVEKICKVSGYRGPIRQAPPRAGDLLRQCADTRLLRDIEGAIALCPMEEGLAETWQWYQTHRESLV